MAYSITDSAGTAIGHTAQSVRMDCSVNRRGQLRFEEIALNEYGQALYQDGGPVTFQDGGEVNYHVEAGTLALNVGETVYMKDGAGAKLLGGTVESISESDFTRGELTHRRAKYTAVDFDQVASRVLVAQSYTSSTLLEIVSDIHTNYLSAEGITLGTVQTGPTITKAVFNYRSAADVFDELARLAGFSWWIDADKALQFRERAAILAPWDLTTANKDYRGIRVDRKRYRYRNSQYIRAGVDLTAAGAETFVGDGERRTFNVQLPVGAAPTVEVDTGGGYVAKTVGVNGLASGVDWYYNLGRTEVTQDSGGTKLTSGHTLRVTYQGQFPVLVLAEDTDEQATRAAAEGFGTGKYESFVDARDIDDDDLAFDKALALLRQHGRLPVSVEYETDTTGLAAGQLQTITLPDHGLSGQYLIESLSVMDRGDTVLRHRVKALSGEAFGGWTDYFRALKEAGRDYVIRENELLILLRSMADGVKVADTATGTTTTSSGTTVGSSTAYVGLCDVG